MAITPLWLRDVKIAPDGKTIAFCYKGDVWTVPTAGGEAQRVTNMDAYQANPIWSPDSKTIAFAADEHGNFDIFTVAAQGGKAHRVTFNSTPETPEMFSPDGKEIYFSANIQDPVKSASFPTARMTELYTIPTTGGAPRQVFAVPAQRLCWGLADAKKGWFLYQDMKGHEMEWRKHHTSSITRDIWRYDIATGKHTNLTNHRPGEDRDPVVEGDNVYFLSERNGGSMNVYVAPVSNINDAKAVTSFKEHPVRFLSASKDGLLCYTYDGEIYTQKPGAKPVKVAIDVVDDTESPVEKLQVRGMARSATQSPDGKMIAFTSRGDLFVTSADYSTTKQISSTPEGESSPTWSKDGKTLYYSSERDGLPNIYQATMAHADDPNFANATVINEKPVLPAGVDRRMPQVSPDGKSLAFIADRNKLCVMDIKSKKVRQLTDGSRNPSRRGGFSYSWSPDSKWIVMEVMERHHEPYSDVAILNVQTGEITNLTNTGYFAEGARFTPDGNAIIYATDRYGMRNHASWGSMMDVMIVYLNQDAYDRARLSEEDYKALKELEKNSKKETASAEKLGKKDGKEPAAKESKSKDIVVELDGITDRTMRLTPMSSNLRDAFITADGDNLYYMMSGPDGTQLWKLNLRKGDHKMVTKLSGASGFDITPDGKNILVAGMPLRKLDTKTDKLTPVSFSSTMILDPAAERQYMFDYVVREEGERFYNKGMHGVNWPKLTDHYRKFMPHIANNYDFAELLSELLGELNVSHTGGRYSHNPGSQADRTASLGLLYDLDYDGDGYKVAEVVKGGPFDRKSSKLAPGMIIKAINGKELKAGENNDALLNDISGKKTLVTFYNPTSKATEEEVIIPISSGKMNSLLYDRWVKARAADVERWSNGRLGYVHIKSMDDPSFRTLYSDALGKYNDCDGIVLDIRWNGGGRLHEDIEVMFTSKKYLTQEIRGVDVCDMPSRRWNKPSIMVMSEACYSNAHGTPWMYKYKKIGKLVGAPVPGTMTSVNWVTMQDPSMVFGIPAIGYRTAEGTYLENSQLEPDIKVFNAPETLVSGEDTQLHTAVDELLREIDAQKGK